jgi:hypothetical protein
MSEPFIPRDKPKAWVIFICAGLIAVLGFGPLMFIGEWLQIGVLEWIGTTGFLLCWATAAAMSVILIPNTFAGKYRNLQPRPWKEQVW